MIQWGMGGAAAGAFLFGWGHLSIAILGLTLLVVGVILVAWALDDDAHPPKQAQDLYDVAWRRPDDREILRCHQLTASELAKRLAAANRNYGPLTIVALTPTVRADSATAALLLAQERPRRVMDEAIDEERRRSAEKDARALRALKTSLREP
jgi:hypothetical protein